MVLALTYFAKICTQQNYNLQIYLFLKTVPLCFCTCRLCIVLAYICVHQYIYIYIYIYMHARLCDELITHPEVSYRLWCVVVCDLETS